MKYRDFLNYKIQGNIQFLDQILPKMQNFLKHLAKSKPNASFRLYDLVESHAVKKEIESTKNFGKIEISKIEKILKDISEGYSVRIVEIISAKYKKGEMAFSQVFSGFILEVMKDVALKFIGLLKPGIEDFF